MRPAVMPVAEMPGNTLIFNQIHLEWVLTMKLRPLHDRVIVKRLEEERKSAGGIVIPDTAAEKPSMGEIIAVGPGKTDDNGKLIPIGVKPGDKILFGKYSGQEFKLEGADYLHMREDDIIGIVG